MESEFGCCRAEPFTCRKPYEMFSFLLSRYRVKPEYDPYTPRTDVSLTNNSQRSVTNLFLSLFLLKLTFVPEVKLFSILKYRSICIFIVKNIIEITRSLPCNLTSWILRYLVTGR